jgi:4-amino-4-deoxy-L-arabinose transferase-like glycosyltransferase
MTTDAQTILRARLRLRRAQWVWWVEGLVVALLLLAEALLFVQGARGRQADYDEGVYAASVDAVRHGQHLGSDVFTSQPPGFYEILRVGSFVFGNSLGGLRALIIAFALLGCLAAYVFGRELGGLWFGLLCSAVLAVAPSYSTFAGRISADLPAAALLLVAVALAFHRGERTTDLWRWTAIGCVVGLAFTVKLSALAIVPMLAMILARTHQRWSRAAAFAAGALLPVAALVLAHLGALDAIWRGTVSYHVSARKVAGGDTLSQNAHRVLHYLDFRTGFGWLVVGALLAALRVVRRPQLEVLLPWLAFAIVGAVFIVWQRPLHDNHLVLLAVVLALPTGYILGEAVKAASPDRVRAAAVAIIALLLVGGYGQEVRRLVRNQIVLSPDLRWAVSEIRRHSPAGQLVITDRPDLAYLAGRQVPGPLVDTAVLRFETGYVTVQEVEQEIQRKRVGVVVAGRAFTLYPALMRWLARHFTGHEQRGDVTLFFRRSVAPPARAVEKDA